MTDERTPDSSDRDSSAQRFQEAEEAIARFAVHVPGVRASNETEGGGISGISKRIVGFRREDDTVDAVDALTRLFTAIGDLLRLAQAHRDDDASAAGAPAAGTDQA